jgi:hypothetical protein
MLPLSPYLRMALNARIWLSVRVCAHKGYSVGQFLRGPGMILSWLSEAQMNQHFRSGPTHSAN